jgi:hypothetical protein
VPATAGGDPLSRAYRLAPFLFYYFIDFVRDRADRSALSDDSPG